MVRPSRRGRSRPLTSTEESDGVTDGDAIDWPTSPTVDDEAVDKWKQPVRFATTADLAIATGLNAGDVVDGVTLADGDRGLVKNEAAPELNGIYVVGDDPERAPDFDTASDVLGSIVYVIEGTTNGGKVFRVDLTDEPVMGIDPITFDELSGGGTISELDDIGDVDASSPSDGDVLTFDTGSGDWIAAAPTDVAYSPVSVTDDGDHYYLLVDGDGTPVLVEV